MKILISENQMMSLKLRRRGIELDKIGNIIDYQTVIQDPCDFEDASEYAYFCIGQGISFYYCDEDYCDEDDEDYREPSEEMIEVREDVENYLNDKYYSMLTTMWNEYSENC
jgi:hypothetical protein